MNGAKQTTEDVDSILSYRVVEERSLGASLTVRTGTGPREVSMLV